jgi:hypothetical protein
MAKVLTFCNGKSQKTPAIWGIRLFLRVVFVCIPVLSSLANASDIFIPGCSEMLADADAFAQDCLTNAREFTRDFYPSGHGPAVPETHSAYFRSAPPSSHFALGCTLNRLHKIEFLGLYYSIDPNNFAKANVASFRFIDFQGNVGLTVDGSPVTLLAVRQFGDLKIPLRFPGRVKNCESAILSDGTVMDDGGQFGVEGELESPAPNLKVCYFGSCKSYEFNQFFMQPGGRIVFHTGALRVLISSTGSLLVERNYLEASCGKWFRNLDRTQNIASELCGIQPNRSNGD